MRGTVVPVVLLRLLTPAATEAQTYPQDVEARISQVEGNVAFAKFRIAGRPNLTIADRMNHHGVKALSIAVIKDYRIDWAKAYGWADAEERRAATTETLFQPGSISKSLNAVAVLRLVQEGKLDLNRDINQDLKSWQFPYDSLAKGKPITLGHLLSHTAGLGVHGFWGYNAGDPLPSLTQILDGVPPAISKPVRSLFEPGLRFEYSGGGTMISEQIVVDATGRPYAEYLREAVLEPLGMTSSSYTQPPPASIEPKLATGYAADGRPITGKFPIMAEQAAAGLWTTPTDLARFIIELQLSREGRSQRVLETATTRLMTTPYLAGADAPGGVAVGLGVFLESFGGHTYFQHGAGNQGFSGQYFGSLEGGNGVVVLINSDAGFDLVKEVINTVAQVYRWEGFPPGDAPPTRTVVSVPSAALERFVGAYRDVNGVVTITRRDGKLWYQASGAPWEMYFTTPTTFFNLESGSDKAFILTPRGRVTGLIRSLGGKEVGRAHRVPVVGVPSRQTARYVGEYRNAADEPVRVLADAGALWILSDRTRRQIRFLSPTEFYTTEDFGVQYQFVIDQRGAITSIATTEAGERAMIRRIGR